LACEWVADKTWTYKTTFSAPATEGNVVTALAFDGLDTYAIVRLNGEVILESDNMFIPHRCIITDLVKAENTLEIDFASARLKAREIKAAHPDHKWLCWNGDEARMASRKAQYHWCVANFVFLLL
jgi:beta-mannosidase